MANKDWWIKRLDLPSQQSKSFRYISNFHVTGFSAGNKDAQKLKIGDFVEGDFINFKDHAGIHQMYLHIDQLQTLFNHLVSIGAIDVPTTLNAALVEAANNVVALQQPIDIEEKKTQTTTWPFKEAKMSNGLGEELVNLVNRLEEIGDENFDSINYRTACVGLNKGIHTFYYTRLQLMITDHPIPLNHSDVAMYRDNYSALLAMGFITKVFLTTSTSGYGTGPRSYYAATERGYRVWSAHDREIENPKI